MLRRVLRNASLGLPTQYCRLLSCPLLQSASMLLAEDCRGVVGSPVKNAEYRIDVWRFRQDCYRVSAAQEVKVVCRSSDLIRQWARQMLVPLERGNVRYDFRDRLGGYGCAELVCQGAL